MTRRPLLALALLLAAGCSAPKLHRQNHDALAAALTDLDAGRTQEAARRMEDLVADLQPVSRSYPLQLYYAASVLASAHARASLGDPFLDDGGARAGRRLARVAHLVGTLWWTHFGRALVKQAGGEPGSVDGAAQVPSALAAQDVPATALRLDLLELHSYVRLEFASRVEAIVLRHPELARHAEAEEALADAGLSGGIATWIHWALFEHLADDDPIEAYKFGISARQGSEEAGDTFGSERNQRIVDWILNHPKYEWRSAAGNAFHPGRDRDPEGEPNIEFVAYPKN